MLLCVCVAASLFVSLLEEMYPVEEVGSILDGVKSTVKSQVSEDLERLAQQSALYLRQLFLQAEGNGVAINVDLSQLDDASVEQTHRAAKRAPPINESNASLTVVFCSSLPLLCCCV